MQASLGRAWLWIVAASSGAPVAAQEAPDLRRVSTETLAPHVSTPVPLRAPDGRRVGHVTFTAEHARLVVEGRGELVAPRLQRWLASSDGRTLVGAGDARMPEHPFALEVRIYRDGELAETLPERFDPESELTVGDEGTVALAGQRAGERGRPLAWLSRPDGSRMGQSLLPGTVVRDPVVCAGALLVRSEGLPGAERSTPRASAGEPGRILRVDEQGVRILYEAPEILGLHGFPGARGVLVHERAGLSWLDGTSGALRWRRAGALRPASPLAWTLWRSSRGDVLALATAGLKRSTGRAPGPPRLELLDAGDGTLLASRFLPPGGPPGRIVVHAEAAELVVEGQGWREVFTW